MQVLVTGAYGFIGRRLAEHFLRDGHMVGALVHASKRSLKLLPGVEMNNRRKQSWASAAHENLFLEYGAR